MTTRLTNGRAMAAILAAGIGSLTLGLMTTGAELSEALKGALTLSDAVGPLSGKTSVATAAYLVSWVVLHAMWKDRDVNFDAVVRVTAVMIALGVLLTFPPVFRMFG